MNVDGISKVTLFGYFYVIENQLLETSVVCAHDVGCGINFIKIGGGAC